MKFLPLYNADFIKLYEDFERSIHTQGYSRGKDCEFPAHVKEFLFFLETKQVKDIRDVKVGEIISFIEYLRQRPNQRRTGGLSDSSMRKHVYALRLFFDHLLTTQQIDSSPARLPKFQMGGNKEMSVLTVEEIKQLYAVCRNRFERAILSLAYGCGLRRSEIEALNAGDVLFQKGIIDVRKGKGNKPRTVAMTDKVMQDLRGYVVYERDKKTKEGVHCPAFFLNKYGNRLLGQQLSYHVGLLVKRAGNDSIIRRNVTLHTFRRSIATHLMDNGAQMDFVKIFLGHVLLDTTHIYSKRRKQRVNLYNVFGRHQEH